MSEKKAEAVYCGIGKSNKKQGTAEECLNSKQVRLYGLKKIPKEVLEKKELLKNKKKLEREYREGSVSLRAMVKKAEKIIKDKERINSAKYLKDKLALLDTDEEKEKAKKSVIKRRKEIKEESEKLKNKIERQIKTNENLKKEIDKL